GFRVRRQLAHEAVVENEVFHVGGPGPCNGQRPTAARKGAQPGRRLHPRRGSKASRTTSAKRLAASTNTNMNTKAAANDHQTIGSRASSARAMLIIVPKLIVVGSTPMPT